MNTEKQRDMKRGLVKYTQNSDYKMVDQLLADGADPTAYLSEPVRIAIKKNDIDMLNIFLKNGYQPSANNSIAFIEAIKNDNVAALKMMLRIENPSLAVLPAAKRSENREIKKVLNATFHNEILR